MDNTTSNRSRSGAAPTVEHSNDRLPLAASLHIPSLFSGILPRPVRDELRRLRVRALMHDFKRQSEIQQSIEDALASASVSIVVPVHDAPAVTKRCLASLEKYAPKAEIVLVNDGSRLLETSDIIRDFIGRNGWKLVQHEKPLGHSLASEAGASLTNRPYICLLNSDTVVTPWCWRLVQQAFALDQNIAVVGPSTSSSGNLQTLPVARYLRQHWNDNQICDFAMRLLSECKDAIVQDLTWASGFAFFIRRSVWEQLGGFDRNLPDFGNEVELCERVAAKGYRRVWVRNAYIHHLGGQSFGQSTPGETIAARTEAAWTYIRQKERSLNS
jgi:GT2 family glycosyltransferase